MRRLLLIPVLFAIVATAEVQNQRAKKRGGEAAIVWSGNQLYDVCQLDKTEKLKGGLGHGCFMYIAGVTQTLVLNDDTETTMMAPCPRKAVTNDQLADVVIKWLGDHPEKRDLPAPYIVMQVLNEAFPCH